MTAQAYHSGPEFAAALATFKRHSEGLREICSKPADVFECGRQLAQLFGPHPNHPKLLLLSRSKPARRSRGPSLDRVKKQAAKAGIAVASYTVNPDGSITIVPGQPNELITTFDQWKAKRQCASD